VTVAELIGRLKELEPDRVVVIQDVGGCCAYPLHSCEAASYRAEAPRVGAVDGEAGEPAVLLIPE
jgi:hypothetical protein